MRKLLIPLGVLTAVTLAALAQVAPPDAFKNLIAPSPQLKGQQEQQSSSFIPDLPPPHTNPPVVIQPDPRKGLHYNTNLFANMSAVDRTNQLLKLRASQVYSLARSNALQTMVSDFEYRFYSGTNSYGTNLSEYVDWLNQ